MLAPKVHSIIRSKQLPLGYPLVFDPKKSKGSYIHDSLTGRKYIDMFSFYGSCPIGHNHPKMKGFARELGAMAIHNPANSNVYTEEYAKFVESFGKWLPIGFNKMFFINGGALAVENACKAAFDWKVGINEANGIFDTNVNDLKIVHFTDAFHGRSGYTMSMTNTDPAKTANFPKFDWTRIKFPKPGQENESIRAIKLAIANDHRNIAAIIAEPVQGEGGDNHMSPVLWKALWDITRETNIMLIADEVQTGLGLTGRTWAYEWLGNAPDMIVFGKKTQVCGFASSNRIDSATRNVFNVPSRLNSTWGGNLVDMMRARKYLEIIEEEDLMTNALEVGHYALGLIQALCMRHPTITSNPRGKGLMIAFDLFNSDACTRFKDLMYERGIIIVSAGANTIRLRPMLDVTKQTIDKVVTTMEKCLQIL